MGGFKNVSRKKFEHVKKKVHESKNNAKINQFFFLTMTSFKRYLLYKEWFECGVSVFDAMGRFECDVNVFEKCISFWRFEKIKNLKFN